MDRYAVRTYKRDEAIVFLKTKEQWGGLSNMAGGYPLEINGVRVLTSEALYQACRFPLLPSLQKEIIGQNSPMTAKMKSKPYRKSDSRPDWEKVRVKVMRWCLRVKLAQNWDTFGDLLVSTGANPIVEESRRDTFWGAKPIDVSTLEGMNVLGRLLMELREELHSPDGDNLRGVEPLQIPDFLFLGQPIGRIGPASEWPRRSPSLIWLTRSSRTPHLALASTPDQEERTEQPRLL